eukprot:CAMPEP_0181022064 /NCGR_PEP_ID=MMETSP1070-20121207/1318_1 /TAXON_ID=265543 /ORGANISM="Minutocellus polymorphus, Strain NH13" /LENGTH=83 /DNA_ID=CAMNT_0023098987 /DNA_START=561 /DNA_END=812 /DNA_ORIENTATION=+
MIQRTLGPCQCLKNEPLQMLTNSSTDSDWSFGGSNDMWGIPRADSEPKYPKEAAWPESLLELIMDQSSGGSMCQKDIVVVLVL